MQFNWVKRGRDGGGRVEWIGITDSRVVWRIWQHVSIARGTRSIAFRLIRTSPTKIVGDFPTLVAAKAKAEKLGE